MGENTVTLEYNPNKTVWISKKIKAADVKAGRMYCFHNTDKKKRCWLIFRKEESFTVKSVEIGPEGEVYLKYSGTKTHFKVATARKRSYPPGDTGTFPKGG